MDNLGEDYWSNRYTKEDTTWDIGYPSTPIKEYIDQLKNKNIEILIPGAGNAYEAEYLFNKGFANTHLLDFAQHPLDNFKARVPLFKKENLHKEDFFEHQGKYDLIIEQTFFCAIHPSLRKKYAVKMAELLKPGGKLVGLLFNDTLNSDKPPFGGNKEEYRSYFTKYFHIEIFETAYNSIPPRAGRELFICLQRGVRKLEGEEVRK